MTGSSSSRSVDWRRAFTLVELLAVLAIVTALVGLVLGGGWRAGEVASEAKTKAELAALSAGLESYRREHGDYPQGDGSIDLVQALIGRRGPRGEAMTGRALIEAPRFTTANAVDPFVDASAELVDAWGQPYRYYYKVLSPTGWKVPGFVLYSVGPNGTHQPPDLSTGFFDPLALENADNLYAGR